MKQTSADSIQGTILSAMRPTGDLHIGHFEGVLRNWIALQETHNCFYFVADWHALTTETNTGATTIIKSVNKNGIKASFKNLFFI